MSAIFELQNANTLTDVLSSLYLAFFVYNYTMIVRNFNSFYFMQLMYIISFSFRSQNQFATKLHVSHLYVSPQTLDICQTQRNCSYLPQLIMMGGALFLQIMLGWIARIKRKTIRESDGAKYVIRRIYFTFYSIVKATSIPVFVIFLDSCIDLKDTTTTIVSGLILFLALILNILVFRALTFLNIRKTSRQKIWLDLLEYVVFYLSTLSSYLGFRYEIKLLNISILGLLVISCVVSWKIKDRLIREEQRYLKVNNIQGQELLINQYKKRENLLELLFFIVQLISLSLLIYYFSLKDSVVSSHSVDTIIFLAFSGPQFILISIILILRIRLSSCQKLNNYLDNDGLPELTLLERTTANQEQDIGTHARELSGTKNHIDTQQIIRSPNRLSSPRRR